MTAVWITIRIVLFLAIVVPVIVWLVRAVRLQKELPADRASTTAHYQNQAFGHAQSKHDSGGLT